MVTTSLNTTIKLQVAYVKASLRRQLTKATKVHNILQVSIVLGSVDMATVAYTWRVSKDDAIHQFLKDLAQTILFLFLEPSQVTQYLNKLHLDPEKVVTLYFY